MTGVVFEWHCQVNGGWRLRGSTGEADGMTHEPATYPRHRFPAEIISHAVWLYHVFSLSLRDVELILAERGVVVTHESIRHWCLKFGADFARRLRRRRPQPGDTWHLDEVFIRIRGVLHYLWRAVDQHGVVLDILVQERRNGAAAKRFFKRLLHGLQYKPRRLVTDGLRSYGVAQRAILPDVRHRTSRYLNNRAENSHRPTRRRERQMQRFKSAESGPAISLGARHDLRPLPATSPPYDRSRLPTRSVKGIPGLATGDLRSPISMTLCGPLQTAFTHLRISYLPMPLARDRSLPSAGLFTVACVLVWTSFSLAAMLLQWGLDSAGMLSQTMATSSVIIAGVVLIAAGVCQCSLKARLSAPLSFAAGVSHASLAPRHFGSRGERRAARFLLSRLLLDVDDAAVCRVDEPFVDCRARPPRAD